MRNWLLALALVLGLSGCGRAPAQPFLTMNGVEVTEEAYLLHLERHLLALPDAPTAAQAEAIKAGALRDTTLFFALRELAAEQGLAPAAETLDALGALYETLCLAQTEDALAAFAAKEGYCTIDAISIPAGEGAADTAAALFARLNAGEDFAALKASLGDTTPPTTAPRDDPMAPGTLSGIQETETGFAILYCLPLDTHQLRIPCLDETLRRRAQAVAVLPGAGYESMDISRLYARLSEKNVSPSPGASSK